MMLADRVAIVTGGAAGIGEAIVRRFADEGAAVAILDRDLQAAERVAATLAGADVSCLACDVSIDANVAAAIDSVLARYKKIDILVNNAGIVSTSTPISDFTE